MRNPQQFTALLALLLLLAGCRAPSQAPAATVEFTLTISSNEPIGGLEAILQAAGRPLALLGVESIHPSVLVVAHHDEASGRIRLALISSEGVMGEVARVHLNAPQPEAVSLTTTVLVGPTAEPLPHAQLQTAVTARPEGIDSLGYDVERAAARIQRALEARSVAP